MLDGHGEDTFEWLEHQLLDCGDSAYLHDPNCGTPPCIT
jgi:hypothetical protein